MLSAAFRLPRGDPGPLLAEVAADAELRRRKHPLDQGSCGSYFRNPSRELPAARLIEAAGLKGFTIGQRPGQREARQLPRRAARGHCGRHRRPGGRGRPSRARAQRLRARRRGATPRASTRHRAAKRPRSPCARACTATAAILAASAAVNVSAACRRLSLCNGRKAIEDLPYGLADRLRRGEPEARIEFFRRYAPQARRILFLQGYCDEVDDAVQDVFLKVFRAQIPPGGDAAAVVLPGHPQHGSRSRAPAQDAGRPGGTLCRASRRRRAPILQPARLIPHFAGRTRATARRAARVRRLRFFADLALEDIATAQEVPVGHGQVASAHGHEAPPLDAARGGFEPHE